MSEYDAIAAKIINEGIASVISGDLSVVEAYDKVKMLMLKQMK